MSQVDPAATPEGRPPRPMTSLVLTDEPVAFSSVQTTDARIAVQRGLAEYLAQGQIDLDGGRRSRFKKVFEEWAEPEEIATMPAAVVLTTGSGSYANSGFAPQMDARCKLPDGKGYLIKVAEFTQLLTVEVWASDPVERMGLGILLERMFNPRYDLGGFRLQLPHYFNAVASFSLTEMMVPDSEDQAVRRQRKAAYTLQATLPVYVVFGFPDFKPYFQLVVVSSVGDEASVVTNIPLAAVP